MQHQLSIFRINIGPQHCIYYANLPGSLRQKLATGGTELSMLTSILTLRQHGLIRAARCCRQKPCSGCCDLLSIHGAITVSCVQCKVRRCSRSSCFESACV